MYIFYVYIYVNIYRFMANNRNPFTYHSPEPRCGVQRPGAEKEFSTMTAVTRFNITKTATAMKKMKNRAERQNLVQLYR